VAEISYPFTEASATGGTTAVSEVEWQSMARMWGGDRIDFRLTAQSYAAGGLPFAASVINGRTVQLQPGNAFVGGFYYQLTAELGLSVEPNPTDRTRKDTLILRADLALGSVNAVIVKGQPAASPVAPQPQRRPGDVWEMVLYEIDVPARDGGITISSRLPFDMPSAIATPWNTRLMADFAQPGTFLYDMDNNGGDTQYEAWTGRDGYVITRHLGKSRTYIPSLTNTEGDHAWRLDVEGRWRWIAPGMVWFSIYMYNRTQTSIFAPSNRTLGITVPVTAAGFTGQVIPGFFVNSSGINGIPNYMAVQGRTLRSSGSAQLLLYVPGWTSPSEGLDSFKRFTPNSYLSISGVYETTALG
jgi:hypothetical protein